jgi:hypothetical protein
MPQRAVPPAGLAGGHDRGCPGRRQQCPPATCPAPARDRGKHRLLYPQAGHDVEDDHGHGWTLLRPCNGKTVLAEAEIRGHWLAAEIMRAWIGLLTLPLPAMGCAVIIDGSHPV